MIQPYYKFMLCLNVNGFRIMLNVNETMYILAMLLILIIINVGRGSISQYNYCVSPHSLLFQPQTRDSRCCCVDSSSAAFMDCQCMWDHYGIQPLCRTSIIIITGIETINSVLRQPRLHHPLHKTSHSTIIIIVSSIGCSMAYPLSSCSIEGGFAKPKARDISPSLIMQSVVKVLH